MADGASPSSGKKKKKKSIFGPLVRCFAGHHKEPIDEEGRVQEDQQAAPNVEAAGERAPNVEAEEQQAPNLEAEEAAPNLEAEEEEPPNLEAGEEQAPDLHDEEEEGANLAAEEEQASDLEDEEAASNPSDGVGARSADGEAGSSSSATTGSPASGASLSSIDSFVLRRRFRLNPSPSAPAAASVPGPSNAAAAVADPGTSGASAAGDGAPAEVSSSALQQPAGDVLLVDSHGPRMTRLANALLELNPLLRVRGLDEYDPRITKTTYNFYDLAIVRHVLPDIDGCVMTWVLKRQVQVTCPVIVLSLMHEGETELFLSSGAQEFIDGPLGKGGLRALLERHHLLEPAAPPPVVPKAGAAAAQGGSFSVRRSRRGRSKSGSAAVTLPRAAAVTLPHAAAAVADPGPFGQPEGKRVLLIDCRQERRTRVVDALMELNPGLRVHAFDEYDPRITKTKPNYYDLAIVRHVPPEIDGCVMAWVLKHNVQISCPVVVLSLMHKGDKDHFYENGAQEVIDGPIGTEGLRALLVKHRLLVPEPLQEPAAAG